MTPGPKDLVMEDEDLTNENKRHLNVDEHTKYRSILGKLMFVACSYRHDLRYAVFILALRAHNPRVWELKCITWCAEYAYNTRNLPLVLGGATGIQVLIFSDASLGGAYEKRSIKGHILKFNEDGGAIASSVHCIKCAVKAVFHPELAACADGIETALYAMNILTDLKVNMHGIVPSVKIDNKSVSDWINGDNHNLKTRGLDALYYSIRHLVQEDIVKVSHLPGCSNESDILTKILSKEDHWKHTKSIMGLKLLQRMKGFKYLVDLGSLNEWIMENTMA